MDEFLRYWNETTRLDHDRIRRRLPDRANEPPPFKRYPGAETIGLPPLADAPPPAADLWALMHRRRSVRTYAPDPLRPEALAALLWATAGVTARMGPYHLRPAPSAGALYPFETYLFLNNVAGIEPGLAHLDVENFRLERLATVSLGERLAEASLGQRFLAAAPVVFAFTAIPARSGWKYGARASRYIGLDLGHVCQDLCLAAEALGLGTCAVGAFLDEPLNRLLGVDGEEEYAFYLASAGASRQGGTRRD